MLTPVSEIQCDTAFDNGVGSDTKASSPIVPRSQDVIQDNPPDPRHGFHLGKIGYLPQSQFKSRDRLTVAEGVAM